MSSLAQRRFLPLAAAWLLVLACVLAAPLRAAAVMTTPPTKLASWDLDLPASGRPGEQAPANQSGIRVNEPCGYETASGRSEWLSRDPIGEAGGLNLYGYVENNPVNLTDPLGLWAYFQPSTWFDGKGYQPGVVENDISEAAQATLDGLIPFADPFGDNGGYDKCDTDLEWSRTLGALSRDLYSGATALRLARLVPKGRYNPWLGDIQRHAAHSGGPHQYPHLQLMLRTGASRTSTLRIPLGPGP